MHSEYSQERRLESLAEAIKAGLGREHIVELQAIETGLPRYRLVHGKVVECDPEKVLDKKEETLLTLALKHYEATLNSEDIINFIKELIGCGVQTGYVNNSPSIIFLLEEMSSLIKRISENRRDVLKLLGQIQLTQQEGLNDGQKQLFKEILDCLPAQSTDPQTQQETLDKLITSLRTNSRAGLNQEESKLVMTVIKLAQLNEDPETLQVFDKLIRDWSVELESIVKTQFQKERLEQILPVLVNSRAVDLTLTDDRGRTALIVAIENNIKEVIGALLAQRTQEQLGGLYKGRSPLLEAVASYKPGDIDRLDIINQLLTHGADILAKEALTGKTVLHYAIESIDLELVKILVAMPGGKELIEAVDNTATNSIMLAAKKYLEAMDQELRMKHLRILYRLGEVKAEAGFETINAVKKTSSKIEDLQRTMQDMAKLSLELQPETQDAYFLSIVKVLKENAHVRLGHFLYHEIKVLEDALYSLVLGIASSPQALGQLPKIVKSLIDPEAHDLILPAALKGMVRAVVEANVQDQLPEMAKAAIPGANHNRFYGLRGGVYYLAFSAAKAPEARGQLPEIAKAVVAAIPGATEDDLERLKEAVFNIANAVAKTPEAQGQLPEIAKAVVAAIPGATEDGIKRLGKAVSSVAWEAARIPEAQGQLPEIAKAVVAAIPGATEDDIKRLESAVFNVANGAAVISEAQGQLPEIAKAVVAAIPGATQNDLNRLNAALWPVVFEARGAPVQLSSIVKVVLEAITKEEGDHIPLRLHTAALSMTGSTIQNPEDRGRVQSLMVQAIEADKELCIILSNALPAHTGAYMEALQPIVDAIARRTADDTGGLKRDVAVAELSEEAEGAPGTKRARTADAGAAPQAAAAGAEAGQPEGGEVVMQDASYNVGDKIVATEYQLHLKQANDDVEAIDDHDLIDTYVKWIKDRIDLVDAAKERRLSKDYTEEELEEIRKLNEQLAEYMEVKRGAKPAHGVVSSNTSNPEHANVPSSIEPGVLAGVYGLLGAAAAGAVYIGLRAGNAHETVKPNPEVIAPKENKPSIESPKADLSAQRPNSGPNNGIDTDLDKGLSRPLMFGPGAGGKLVVEVDAQQIASVLVCLAVINLQAMQNMATALVSTMSVVLDSVVSSCLSDLKASVPQTCEMNPADDLTCVGVLDKLDTFCQRIM